MRTQGLELEFGCVEESGGRGGHTDLVGGSGRHHPGRDVDRQTTDVRAHPLVLAAMDAGPDREPQSARRSDQGEGTPDGADRAVEQREHAVAGGVDLAPPVSLDLDSGRRIELTQQATPSPIPQTSRSFRRTDDVGEQYRAECMLAESVDSHTEVAPAERVDRNEALVALDPGVVSWRDFERVVGPEQDRRTVVHRHPEVSRDHEPEMVD